MKYIVVFLMSLIGFSAYSQDVITTKKGEDIQAKVLEITLNEIKYKKFDNPNSPVYTLLKSDVLLIRYENGSKDIFNNETPITENKAGNGDNTPKNRITIIDKTHFLNGKRISGSEMKSILYQDQEARAIYKKSQGFRTGEIVCGVVGCLFATVGLVAVIADPQSNTWLYADAAAVGFLVPSFIFRGLANKQKAQAIEKYNSNQDKKVTINPIIGKNSIGVVVRF
ncbi:hypothetical protein [Capnocytophaga sp.]|uniref:hypothetical protein n=1 Tax=Capnocytophaga sp. TaxID=44737 RepID=UPI0026DDCAF4|nr:hypothetical protein [Capnocytophaga sp.]MDO5106117.1 hypothetical protein [Capnocytophaga sp.]